MTTRKSFSADRSKNTNESSSSDISSEFGCKTFKVCSSASYESARGRIIREKHAESLVSEDNSPRYLTLHAKDDQKLFLNASQTLEKLNQIISQNTTKHTEEDGPSKNATSHLVKSSLKEIILQHDRLKNLLEERCTLILKEECDICIKRTVKLINEFKLLYTKEKLKIIMMPIQACNRFVSSSDISTSALQFLLKKLQIICDLQSSVSSSYQKIINCFHVGLDLNLYQMVLKTNKILSKLNCSLFYWGFKSMVLFMQKLCLADPNSVSPEFLLSILENCQVFNLLLTDNNMRRHKFTTQCDFFHDYIKNCECKELPFSLVLNYLAFFEAKIAAEKVVHFLTSTCKKCRQADLKKSKITGSEIKPLKIESNTSDYYSDLDTETSMIKEHPFKNANLNFVNVLASITQRNQSLVLKYLYAISNSQNSKSLTKVMRRDSYESTSCYPVRQMWNVSEQSISDGNRIALEEMYWSSFWKNVQKFILKILFEVPYHQYGDAIAGTVILWPDSFIHTLFESLKMIVENKDVTIEGRQVMKQIYDWIFIQKMQISWDKEFSLAISATHSHLCIPVPLTSDQVRTHPGNLLYACLDMVAGAFHTDLHNSNSLLNLKCLYNLQSTLDCFILWLNCKTRAMISSKNLATYLLITRSDCSSTSELLKLKVVPMISSEEFTNTYLKVSSSKRLLRKVILKQIDIIYGHETEVPNIVYKLCFDTLKVVLISALRSKRSWKQCSMFASHSISLDIQEDLIFLLTEVISRLSEPSSVLIAITSAFAHASLYSLKNSGTRISLNNIQLISIELSKHLQWIEKLNLPEAQKSDLKQLLCVRKLNCTLKYIQILASQHQTWLKHRNRVMPSILPEILMEENLVSDQEKQLWQSHTRNFVCSCI